jgi:hypothetical protein
VPDVLELLGAEDVWALGIGGRWGSALHSFGDFWQQRHGNESSSVGYFWPEYHVVGNTSE